MDPPSTHTQACIQFCLFFVAGLPSLDLLFEGTGLNPSHHAEGGNHPEARQGLLKKKEANFSHRAGACCPW